MQDHSSFKESTKETNDDSFNIREQIDQYLVHWKWFILSVVVCIFLAGLYLRYTVPKYRATATILVKDERKGGIQSELSAFSDLGMMTGVKSNVDNEIEVIKSRSIMERAILNLNFNVQYFVEGRVKTIEVYKERPVIIDFYDVNDKFYKTARQFYIKNVSPTKFELLGEDRKSKGQFTYGRIILMPNFKMVVTKHIFGNEDFEVRVAIKKLANVVAGYKGKIGISTLGKNTSVVEMSLEDPVKEKAEDLLDEVIKVYNEDAIADKKYISENTERFIAGRLTVISDELGDVERNAESYKKDKGVTDIVSEAGIYLQNSVTFERELIETETQLRIIQSMMEFMEKASTDDLIP
ncbi:MAG TPA: Wzz/FepE/Etk N-terminal domain-containing protein, partial [Flavobacterium sp.]